MLKTDLIHPQILGVLGKSGHGSRILIADGNYPFITAAPRSAEFVYLNLRPGLVTVCDVLESLVTVVPIEASAVMQPPDGHTPPIFADFLKLLPNGIVIEKHSRLEFYDEAKHPHTSLVIATGDVRRFANILLTIGVIIPTGEA